MIVGYITLSLVVLCFLLAPVLVWWQYKRAKPKIWIDGIGVRFRASAEQPWPYFEEAVRALVLYFQEAYPYESRELCKNVWIDVYGTEDPISGPPIRYNGLYETKGWLLGFKKISLVSVRQLRQYTLHADGTKAMDGKLLTADQSGLFHEFCEHHLALVVTGNVNANHDKAWLQKTYKVITRFNTLVQKGK